MDGWFTVCCLAAAILLYRIDRIKTITSLLNFWLRYSIRGRMRPSPHQPHCKAKFTVSNRRTARSTSPQPHFLSVAIFGDFCFSVRSTSNIQIPRPHRWYLSTYAAGDLFIHDADAFYKGGQTGWRPSKSTHSRSATRDSVLHRSASLQTCRCRLRNPISGGDCRFFHCRSEKLDLKMSLKVILVLLLYMFSKIFV